MENVSGEIDRVGELVSVADGNMRAAETRGQGMKAQLVITEKLARQLDGPADRIETLGHRYATLLAMLDPGVHATLDAVATAASDDSDRMELLKVVQALAMSSDEALVSLAGLVESTKEAAKFSRSLRAPLRRMRTGLQGILDGRAVIE